MEPPQSREKRCFRMERETQKRALCQVILITINNNSSNNSRLEINDEEWTLETITMVLKVFRYTV